MGYGKSYGNSGHQMSGIKKNKMKKPSGGPRMYGAMAGSKSLSKPGAVDGSKKVKYVGAMV